MIFSATLGLFFPSEAHGPIAPQTLNSRDVFISSVPLNAILSPPSSSLANSRLNDSLKIWPLPVATLVKVSVMTMTPPVFSMQKRISIVPTWSSAEAKTSRT